MPATAGRVRMPANNRVHSSAALQTHGIWQSAIGYDPYAPNQTASAHENTAREKSGGEQDGENAYDSFQGLLALARLTASNADEARGACKKCGRVGHLTFQCRNFLSVKDDIAFHDKDQVNKDDDPGANGFIKPKSKPAPSEDSEEEDSSELTDSDEDSDMERILAQKFGNGDKKKKLGERSRVSKPSALARRSKRSRVSESEDSEERVSRRGRSRRKRSGKSRRESRKENSDVESEGFSDESSEEERKRRRKKKKKMIELKKRSRHHCTDTDSGSEDVKRGKRKNRRDRSRRKAADSDSSSSDDEDREVARRKKREKKHRSHKSM